MLEKRKSSVFHIESATESGRLKIELIRQFMGRNFGDIQCNECIENKGFIILDISGDCAFCEEGYG